MAKTSRTEASAQFFDSVLERQTSLYDSVRSAADRYHRFNRSLIEGARQSNRDWTEVTRRWITNPTDVVAVYEAVSDAIGNSQARTLALVREWVEDRAEGQRESREVLRQGLGDVREAVQRVQAEAPEFLRSLGRGNGATERVA